MIPLRAAVLLALEQACRANWSQIRANGADTDWLASSRGYGATVTAISSYVVHPGLVRSSAIRRILVKERIAGRVFQDVSDIAHRWWPAGLAVQLFVERASE